MVVLASNLHRNLDEAFLHRFEEVVYFPPLRAQERLLLWREGFSPRAHVKAGFERIAREHELSGGAIINVIRRVSLVGIAWGGRDADELIGDGNNGEAGISREGIGDLDIEEASRSERGKNL